MDPISVAIAKLRDEFRDFRQDASLRVFRILVDTGNLATIHQAMRLEEWAADNLSPFIVFDGAFTAEDFTFAGMKQVVPIHYGCVREGVEAEGKTLPEFGPLPNERDPALAFVKTVRRFVELTKDLLAPPFLCWLPSDVSNAAAFELAVTNLLEVGAADFRFVITDDLGRPRLTALAEGLKKAFMTVRFDVKDVDIQDYFKRMMLAPPSKARMPGTPPGAAAPDVVPPPRPGPKPPTDEQIRAAAAEAGLPPILTEAQGEQLRRLLFEAAEALGKGDEGGAIEKQTAACQLCADAGTKVEWALMKLLLASYFLQFKRHEPAEANYRESARIAKEAGAHPQSAQASMGLAYLLLQSGRVAEAAAAYEAAAVAAQAGQSVLLFLESKRMAGVCHVRDGRVVDAIRIWTTAVVEGQKAPPGELRASSYLTIGDELLQLLQKRGARRESEHIAKIVDEVKRTLS
jgi:tetratricopeptide (TPR) repeat protein